MADHNMLVEKICHYLSHADERLAITNGAYNFVTQEVTIEHQVGHIVTRLRQQQQGIERVHQ